ncbi:fasciclin domain-containing protein [Pararoseomonas indoligenes]|uniref:Fasciclin domain-containing protein n=1 Tax=Roseomonas indoligenes TaxID=2820811 RepID=A0A940N4P1_9PROT|nr:fasciclin domain-containing protein [Pararoseomonas indoligenes]MBP0495110.1 fasciclin domain-containing protein [Pararoseomonas indoligenes]
MNALRTLALATVAGVLLSSAVPVDAASPRLHSCVNALEANPNYRSFFDAIERVGGTARFTQNQPITIFALDNAEVEKVPPAVRNLFLPLGPEIGDVRGVGPVMDQLVLEGRHPVAEMKPGQEFYTLDEATVQVVGSSEGRPVLRIGGYDMAVVSADQPCNNGLVQGVAYVARNR